MFLKARPVLKITYRPALKDKMDHFTHYQKNENIVNYQNSREKVSEEKAPYEVKRISVAVAIDGIWEILRKDDGDPIITNGGVVARIYHPVDDTSLRSYEDWLKGAVNYDAKRGDDVVVRSIPFDHTKDFEKDNENIRKKIQLRRTLLASIVVLFLLFLALWLTGPLQGNSKEGED